MASFRHYRNQEDAFLGPPFYYFCFTIYYLPKFAPVAQLDRAFDYESKGRTFESCRVHHHYQPFPDLKVKASAQHTGEAPQASYLCSYSQFPSRRGQWVEHVA